MIHDVLLKLGPLRALEKGIQPPFPQDFRSRETRGGLSPDELGLFAIESERGIQSMVLTFTSFHKPSERTEREV